MNKQQEQRLQEAREAGAKCLCDDIDLGLRYNNWSSLNEDEREEYLEEIDQILNLRDPEGNPYFGVIDKEQELPECEIKEFNLLACGAEDDSDNIYRAAYLKAQQDMIKKGWRRVIL